MQFGAGYPAHFLFERDGHGSTAAWLVARLGCSWGRARTDVRLARGLEAMEHVRKGVHAGDVSLCAAGVLTEVRDHDAARSGATSSC